ncbi:U32 family peptidase [Phyllobacterium brassicacearum]|uniref:Ubiquinone biosynthesis protein UbiV n=1 Tax=Phyllobacterium brassicacearum TaxID=314235 RepID=A0A2P7B6C0_9HYPH|nr:U32 family peptidase [Phyllobacterium brassicacearum]PSH62014.1 U32 family peptidase [Phyllobacterium brassicacearum]TDQ14916.1 collagenase-like PrtC family protease [Phyllobacterium brassicacearum]
MKKPAPTLALGPVLYLWDGPKWRDFYFRIADEAPVSHVTVGETVCSKRLHFTEPYIADVIERLQTAGKTVRVVSLAIVTLERESQYVRSLIRDSGHIVEANDLSALRLLNGRPHAVGPLVNVYNVAAARVLAARGATSICLPPELPMRSVAQIVAGVPEVAFEVFSFGRVPLAISARCAHARSKGHTKDNCQFVCSEDPDGLSVDTLEHRPFLALNGVQTVSHTCQALVGELSDLALCGVSRFVLSPQDCDMVAVSRVYDDVLKHHIDVEDAMSRLHQIYPGVPLSNGFHHGQVGAAWIAHTKSVSLGAEI